MKRKISILIIALCTFGAFNAQAQQNCEIPLMIMQTNQAEPIPDGALDFLNNKLRQVATTAGLAAGPEFTQFCIVPKISMLNKEILPGPPSKFVYNMEMTLYIADAWGEKVFTSTNINMKGVGNNETKAYIAGIKGINPRSTDLQQFVNDGKDKIIEYYNTQYPTIIKKAQSLAAMKKYDEALFYLGSIPECSKGYDSALNVAFSVYQQYVDQLCLENLAKAKMVWAAQQNAYGAQEAGEYLQYIYPDAKCYGEAMSLYKEIKGKVLDDWKFVMKIYDDAVSLEKQRINAWRDVGVAYGRGQKNRTTNVYWIR
ncbi:hypothetical protein [Dysgonomonas macrotermitis]|uniref:Tetratricopeptide repeat-containing protein n=1 Tax=Dysgonomonas macrotermitis TaxID=1346286 RepID=A0A1M4SIH7_9BACT|nr:hypothetical protein [Dysgonomonas macrotermitis]SHE32015.1 hypothetical protein SAMN05444362_10173 [Dysgonomonas macrotermitis]